MITVTNEVKQAAFKYVSTDNLTLTGNFAVTKQNKLQQVTNGIVTDPDSKVIGYFRAEQVGDDPNAKITIDRVANGSICQVSNAVSTCINEIMQYYSEK